MVAPVRRLTGSVTPMAILCGLTVGLALGLAGCSKTLDPAAQVPPSEDPYPALGQGPEKRDTLSKADRDAVMARMDMLRLRADLSRDVLDPVAGESLPMPPAYERRVRMPAILTAPPPEAPALAPPASEMPPVVAAGGGREE